MQNVKTLLDLLQHVVCNYRNTSALNYRYLGQWERISTERFAETVRRLGLGLHALGLKPGQGFGIISKPSPHWIMMDLAAMLNRAPSIPMFYNISPENFLFETENADVQYLFIDDEDELDPRIKGRLGHFRKVICQSVRLKGNNFIHFDEVLRLGDELSEKDPTLYQKLKSAVKEDDLATIIYTSGSTGVPKGVELTHRNLVYQVNSATMRFPMDPVSDRILTCLPLAHVFERMVMYFYISTGTSVYFADDIQKVGELLKEVRPTIITLVPRILEKVYDKMNRRRLDEKGVKRLLLDAAFSRAKSRNPDHHTPYDTLLDRLVYSKLRQALGDNFKWIIVGGSALPVDLGRFCMNIGLPLFQGYGMTETSPVIAVNFPQHNRLGTVGLPFPGVEIKLSEQNEILVKSQGIMRGYHKNPLATAEVIDKDGFLHTGDLGKIDSEGFVSITGRLKEMFKTSNGKYVVPIPIEQGLNELEFIEFSLVVAENRNFVTCLLFADMDNINQHKKLRGLENLTPEQFLNHEVLLREVEMRISAVNQKLNQWEQVKKFKIIAEKLTIESGELTPTMKVRRHVVEKKYKSFIDDLYQEGRKH